MTTRNGDALAEELPIDYAKAMHAQEDVLGLEEAVPVSDTVVLDNSASSLVIDYTYPKRISKVEITPARVDHRITPETLSIHTAMFNNDGYYDVVENPVVKIDSSTGVITIVLKTPIYARYMKVHCHYNEMMQDGSPDTSISTFRVSGSDAIKAYCIVGGRNEFYMYDSKGNRTGKSVMATDIKSDSYEYYSDSDLLWTNGKYYYQYDKNGNLIKKGTVKGELGVVTVPNGIAGAEYWEYEYDLKNRLHSVNKYDSKKNSVDKVVEYAYDIDGLRVSKTVGGTKRTDYVFDLSGKILEEARAEESVQYVFLKERHLARVEKGEVLFYGTDHLSSTILMTDSKGIPVWTADASPFGDFTVVSSDSYSNLGLKFTGKDADETTGLYYFNARWYDSDTGRFITEDPIRDGENWYAYCSNNPVMWVDPTGLEVDYGQGQRKEYDDETHELLSDTSTKESYYSTNKPFEGTLEYDRYKKWQSIRNDIRPDPDLPLGTGDELFFMGVFNFFRASLSITLSEISRAAIPSVLQASGNISALRTQATSKVGTIADDAFVRFDPAAFDNSIGSNGILKRYFSDNKVWATQYKYVKGITDPKALETMLYRQNLWPDVAGKFDSGATLRLIQNAEGAVPAGVTNMVNGIPQWRFQRDIPASDLTIIKSIGR